MVNEWLMIGIMTWCGVLFAAGGTHIEEVGGQKWLRRFLMPAGIALIALLSHVLWWKCLGLAVTLSAVLHLGYGSRTPYWLKAVVFMAYGLAFLWLGWSLWVVLTGPICLVLFCLSNWKPTAKDFFWKMCEYSFGLLIGITFISVLHG